MILRSSVLLLGLTLSLAQGLFFEVPTIDTGDPSTKPGRCRWWKLLSCNDPGSSCVKDSDCPGTEKCCIHPCKKSYCAPSIPPHRDPCRGKTCQFQGEECVVDNNNRTRCDCALACPNPSQQVCGNDGYTYPSKCELDRTSCSIGIPIKVLHRGVCGKPLPVTKRPTYSRTTASTSSPTLLRTRAPTTKTISGLQPRCQQPKVEGSCPERGYSVRWYYDVKLQTCKAFLYFGCPGVNADNENNFVTEKQCLSICKEKDSMKNAVCPPVDPPGVCPNKVLDQCTNDKECQLGLKCCTNGCFRKCVKPTLQAKPGRCPKPTSSIDDCEDIQLSNSCDNDHECEGNKKCCRITCGRTCVAPAKKETRCPAVIDIAFLLDSSGSIQDCHWLNMLKFVKDIINLLDISDQATHVAVISYSTNASVDFTFNTFTRDKLNHRELNNAIDGIRHMKGYTFIDKALKKANQEVFTTAAGMRDAVRKILFVFTDGFQTQNNGFTPLDKASQPIKDQGIEIWSIGIGDALKESELRQIATKPSNIETVKSFNDLPTILDKIKDHICKGSSGPAVDIAFLMDTSKIVNLGQVLAFFRWLVEKTGVSADGVHYGLISYSRLAKMNFKFDALKGSGYTVNAVKGLVTDSVFWSSNERRLDLALSMAYRDLFTSKGGARKTAKKVLVIFRGGPVDAEVSSTALMLQQLKDAGIKVITIDQGPGILPENYPDINTIIPDLKAQWHKS